MQGTTSSPDQSFEKVVFESVIDTFAGGVCLDPTGLAAAFPDGIVPAGTLVGEKDPTTGLSKVITITNASPDTYDKTPLGFTMASIKIDNNPLVGVCIEGAVRKGNLTHAGGTITSGQVDDLKSKLPKITFV
jgi:hypothetical protein